MAIKRLSRKAENLEEEESVCSPPTPVPPVRPPKALSFSSCPPAFCSPPRALALALASSFPPYISSASSQDRAGDSRARACEADRCAGRGRRRLRVLGAHGMRRRCERVASSEWIAGGARDPAPSVAPAASASGSGRPPARRRRSCSCPSASSSSATLPSASW